MKKEHYWIIGIVAGLIVIIGLIVGIILLNNKGTATLKCVKTEKETVVDGISTFTIHFKDDKIKLIESKNETIVKSDVARSNIDSLYNAIQGQFGDYKNEKGVIIKTAKLSDRITFTITVDANENPERVEIVGSSLKSNMTYEEVKKELENRKFTCQ